MNLEQQTLDIIESAGKYIGSDKAVLFLGLTGSGKTTLINWLWNKDVLKVIIDGHRRRIQGEDIGVHRYSSSTEVPRHYEHEGIEHYDCPGFRGTRGPAHRLATSYFIKTILDASKQVKFVLVVDHYASHRDLVELLEYVSSFIKDVEKFWKSILFVSTGFIASTDCCQTSYCRDSLCPACSPSSLRDFERKVDELWKALSSYDADEGHAAPFGLSLEKIKIFTTLLKPDEGGNRALACMVQPKSGIKEVNKDADLNSHCELIWETIKSLEFCEVEPADFRHGLTGLEKTVLMKLIDDSDMTVCAGITSMHDSIYKYFDKITEASQSFHLLSKKINRNCAALRRMKEDLVKATTVEEFSSSISRELSDIDLIEVTKAREKLVEHLKWLKVWLNYLPAGDHVRLCRKWKNVVIEAEKECYNHKLWCTTLKRVFDETSSYETQLERYKYDVSDISDWGRGKLEDQQDSSLLRINANNVHRFLRTVLSRSMGDEQQLPPAEFMDGQRLDHLKHLIHITIKSANKIHFSNGVLSVQGNFVRSSLVLERVNQLLQEGSTVISIRVAALHTIYIDSNFKLEACQLTLIAPHVKTINARSVTLNAATGDLNPSSFLCVTRRLEGSLEVSGINGPELYQQIGVSVTGDEPTTKIFGEQPIKAKTGCSSIFLCRRVKLRTPNVVQDAPDLISHANEVYSFIRKDQIHRCASSEKKDVARLTTDIRSEFAKIITDYKMNILKHLNDFWFGERLQRFIEDTLCSHELDSLYTYTSLKDEFEYLNDNNSSHQDQIRLLSFYKALSQRIERLNDENNDKHPIYYRRQAMDLLQTDLEVVIEDMERSIARKFTIDIPGYFESQVSKVMDFNQLKSTLKSLEVAAGSGDEIQLKITNSKKQKFESNLQAMYQTAEYLGILDSEGSDD